MQPWGALNEEMYFQVPSCHSCFGKENHDLRETVTLLALLTSFTYRKLFMQPWGHRMKEEVYFQVPSFHSCFGKENHETVT